MRTPYELESLGWKITRINDFNESVPIKTDFNIFHAFHFPYGYIMKNTTLGSVLEFIDNFIKEDQHKEEIERFNLDK